MTDPSSPPVFLSYASIDRQRALAVADALEAADIRVWIDRRGIAGGTVWIEEIAKAVREAPALFVLCSAASVVSRNVRQELQLAWDQDKPILPLLLEPVEFPDGVAYVLHGRQWIELHDRLPAAWIPDVRQALTAMAKPSPTEDAATAPPSTRSSTIRLPVPPNAVRGRDAEIVAITALMGEHRLVTLTGPGGTGKTRLAIEVAARLSDRFPDGISFVDLAPVREPTQVLATIAQVVGVREMAGQPLVERLAACVAGQRLLLLDNFEQVLIGARELADLLAAAPDLSLLVTSRAPLRIRAEHEIPISPLEATPAMTLFTERATARNPAFALTPDNEDTIRELCLRLDGLPLAIELAAARIKLFTPQRLLARLDQRLPTLTGGARDLPARQQTMRATIAWSHDLLGERERALLRRLAIFVGGFDLAAATAVADPEGDFDALDGVAALVEQSLLYVEGKPDGEPRFRMLETVREFALERLEGSGDADTVRDAHAAHFLALAEEAERSLLGPAQAAWLARLEDDRDNLLATLRHLERRGDDGALVRLVTALGEWWDLNGHFGEGRDWLERVLARTDGAPPTIRVRVLLYAGTLAYQQGDPVRAEAWLGEALALARRAGATRYVSYVLSYLGVAAEDRGEYALAADRLREAEAIARRIGDRYLEAVACSHLGVVAYGRGDADEAVARLEAAVAIAGDSVSPVPREVASIYLALIACDRGDPVRAVARLRTIEEFRGQAHHDLVRTVPVVATLAVAAGQPAAAARLFWT